MDGSGFIDQRLVELFSNCQASDFFNALFQSTRNPASENAAQGSDSSTKKHRKSHKKERKSHKKHKSHKHKSSHHKRHRQRSESSGSSESDHSLNSNSLAASMKSQVVPVGHGPSSSSWSPPPRDPEPVGSSLRSIAVLPSQKPSFGVSGTASRFPAQSTTYDLLHYAPRNLIASNDFAAPASVSEWPPYRHQSQPHSQRDNSSSFSRRFTNYAPRRFTNEHDDRWNPTRPSTNDGCQSSKFSSSDRRFSEQNSRQQFSTSTFSSGPSSFNKQRFTGYHFQRDTDDHYITKSRSCSPVEDEPSFSVQEEAAPQNMPEHLRWLHERWKKYNNKFFEEKKESKAEIIAAEQLSKQESWKQEYLKALEERDPYLEDAESYKRLKLQVKVKEATQRASAKANDSVSFDHDRERQKTSSSKRRSRSRSPVRGTSSAQKRMISRFSRPYFEFWKKSALESDMMTFKEFLMSRPGEIEDDKEAVKQYNDYRQLFKKRAFQEYFDCHKIEWWFRQKYHPKEQQFKAERHQADVQARLEVFMRLLVRGWVDVELDHEFSKVIRKTLDAAIVLLEGGTEDMLVNLKDIDYYLEEKKEEEIANEKPKVDGNAQDRDWASVVGEAESAEKSKPGPVQLELMQHSRDYSYYIRERLKEVEHMPDFIGTESEIQKSGVADASHLGQGFCVFEPKEKGLHEMSLHRASALLIRNIPPSVSHEELSEMLSQLHGGYLRLFLSLPDPKNRNLCYAVISFWHNANLAKVAWRLRGYKLRGSELFVVEYKDHSKRIQHVDGVAADKSIVLRDIQLAKSLIQCLDLKAGLWASPPGLEEKLASLANPLLINLDSIIEENWKTLVAEQENLKAARKANKDKEYEVNKDANLVKLLDRLLLYLRIVHSVDYYGCKYFENEDDFPRRIGQIHIRGPSVLQPLPKNLTVYIKEFEAKLKTMFPPEEFLPDEEIEKLGGLELEAEISSFCRTNAAPTRDGIVQCRLCEKRFTSDRFATEHIRAKHPEDIDFALHNVFFFNRYLADPNRPCSAKFV